MTEAMPTSMAGFKDHPLYVLARHLKRDEVVDPPVELGKFRGEPVYARPSVLTLKSAENWIRRGRSIRAGEQPLKWVKQRAVTISRKRELEILKESSTAGAGDVDAMQGLYAEKQTEIYQPLPIVDVRPLLPSLCEKRSLTRWQHFAGRHSEERLWEH